MANIIIKLIPNKWDKKYFFSFIKKGKKRPKDQHFLAFNSFKHAINAGEYWECFIWQKQERKDKVLLKVVPYRKIEEKNLAEERKRIGRFNRELSVIEKYVGGDFEKVVFRRNNMPFLLASKSVPERVLSQKYPNFAFLRDGGDFLARPGRPRPGPRRRA
jgi:hypothetical protein